MFSQERTCFIFDFFGYIWFFGVRMSVGVDECGCVWVGVGVGQLSIT